MQWENPSLKIHLCSGKIYKVLKNGCTYAVEIFTKNLYFYFYYKFRNELQNRLFFRRFLFSQKKVWN